MAISPAFGSVPRPDKGRIIAIYVGLLIANAAAWLWAWRVCQDHPTLLGMAVLAYTLGLRHAVDADHIAAIDNVTRKFLQHGKEVSTIGLHFSLGHSTVVGLACLLTASSSVALRSHLSFLENFGGSFGSIVSATFLFAVALVNAVTLYSLYNSLRARRFTNGDNEALPRGILHRFLRPVIAVVARPWHMFPLGFMFGLGFDTATEISVLGLSASQAAQGISFWSIMVFPALFTAAMALIDTTDGIVMTEVYGWAADKPERRIIYNVIVTSLSVAVAFFVGGLQLLHLVADQFTLKSRFWSWVGDINESFSALGCFIAALFIACWTLSAAASRHWVRKNREGSGTPKF